MFTFFMRHIDFCAIFLSFLGPKDGFASLSSGPKSVRHIFVQKIKQIGRFAAITVSTAAACTEAQALGVDESGLLDLCPPSNKMPIPQVRLFLGSTKLSVLALTPRNAFQNSPGVCIEPGRSPACICSPLVL